MVACRNGPFQLVYSVCFSQFRARDGLPVNCLLQMSSVHMHPRAYVCIINEMSKGKFPDLGKQSIQAKKVYRHFFFLACDTEMQKGITHTQRKVNHDMERKQYIHNYIKRKYYLLPSFFFFWNVTKTHYQQYHTCPQSKGECTLNQRQN